MRLVRTLDHVQELCPHHLGTAGDDVQGGLPEDTPEAWRVGCQKSASQLGAVGEFVFQRTAVELQAALKCRPGVLRRLQNRRHDVADVVDRACARLRTQELLPARGVGIVIHLVTKLEDGPTRSQRVVDPEGDVAAGHVSAPLEVRDGRVVECDRLAQLLLQPALGEPVRPDGVTEFVGTPLERVKRPVLGHGRVPYVKEPVPQGLGGPEHKGGSGCRSAEPDAWHRNG